MASQDSRFPAATTPYSETPDSPTRRQRRLRLPWDVFPTGLPTLLTGVMGFTALLYFQHRSASWWAMAACAAFAGAGLALLLAATGYGRASMWHAAAAGGLAGMTLLVGHTSITNPGACAVAWTGVMVYGVPWVGGAGAVGSALLVAMLRRGGALPAKGGDRTMLAALLIAAIVCGGAVYPFAHNALSYSRLVTGAAFAVRPVRDGQGAGSVVAGDRVLVLQPWLYESVSVEIFDLAGTPGGLIAWDLPEGAGGTRIHVDESDGVPYASWVEPLQAPGASGGEQVWHSVLARLDCEAGEVAQTWAFPAETSWGRLALVHGGYAVLAGEGQVACYALAGQASPVELWRADAPGAEFARAAAGTLFVASYGTQPTCYHLPTGRRFWQVDGEVAAAPVYDHANSLWIVATRDAFMGLSASEGAVWGFPRQSRTRDGGPTMAELFAHDGHLMVMERSSGPSWDWPPVNVTLTAFNAADGRQLWETRVERDAFYFAGHVQGVTFIGGSYGLLLGVGEGGTRVFRTRAGPVSAVVERPDGGLVLVSEAGGIKVGRVRR
ncbi:MAG: PQQ-binding-like beta-propeller repeat protein [Bacillota bacterium]|nr:PQQ-binding-like beta-propeller repeat protein [Bacillota bacterium]